MESDVFDGLCRTLGYQPDSVLSIRVNPREVVLVHVDATGDLHRAIHRIGDERRHRPVPPLGVAPSGRAVQAALRRGGWGGEPGPGGPPAPAAPPGGALRRAE